jgi:hypothetical protein
VIALVLVDVLGVNQLLNPLAYARSSFETLYGAALQSFQAQVNGVERLYGPPLTEIGYRNHALQSRVKTTYGYNPLELAGYADYAAAAEANHALIGGFAASHRVVDGPRVEPIADVLPLAYFARHVVAVADAHEGLASLDPAEETLVVGAAPLVEAVPSASVMVLTRGESAVTLHYESKTPNLLCVAIPFYPGWRARLNDTELPTLTVDGAFIGVVVPPGEGDIELAYTPRFFAIGATTSGIALVVALVALIARRPGRFRRALDHRVNALTPRPMA